MARRPDSILVQAPTDWNVFCASVASFWGSATGHHELLVGGQPLTQKQGHVHATLIGFIHHFAMPRVHSVFPNCNWILYIYKILLYNWSSSLTGVPILGGSQFTPILQDSPPPPTTTTEGLWAKWAAQFQVEKPKQTWAWLEESHCTRAQRNNRFTWRFTCCKSCFIFMDKP